MFSLKKSHQTVCFVLLTAIFLGACATRPKSGDGGRVPQRIVSIEQIVQWVKNNDSDIEKYYTVDEDGQIEVKARALGAAGDFEVVYDLQNAEVIEDGAYRVRFTALAKKTGETREDSLVWRPRAGKAGILLSFDDDYTSSWERHFDLFDRYGAKATFFVFGKPGPFCTKAINRGHDIGYHSLNHHDLRLISPSAFARETAEPAQAFRQAGIPLAAFAYPFGFYEPWMHEALLRTFAVLRGYGVTYRLYRHDEIRSGFIASRSIDNTIIQGGEHFEREITLMLRTVKFLDGPLALPLTTHDISDTADWGISRRRLEFLLKTAADLGLTFYRYSDFADPR